MTRQGAATSTKSLQPGAFSAAFRLAFPKQPYPDDVSDLRRQVDAAMRSSPRAEVRRLNLLLEMADPSDLARVLGNIASARAEQPVVARSGIPVEGATTRQFALQTAWELAAKHIRDPRLREILAEQIAYAQFVAVTERANKTPYCNIALLTTWPKALMTASEVAHALHAANHVPRPDYFVLPHGVDAALVDRTLEKLRQEGPSLLLVDARVLTNDVAGKFARFMTEHPRTRVLIAGSRERTSSAMMTENIGRRVPWVAELAVDDDAAAQTVANPKLRQVVAYDIDGVRQRESYPVRVTLKGSRDAALQAATQYARALHHADILPQPEPFTLIHGNDAGTLHRMLERLDDEGAAVLIAEARMFLEDPPFFLEGGAAEDMCETLVSYITTHSDARLFLHGTADELAALRTRDVKLDRLMDRTITV